MKNLKDIISEKLIINKNTKIKSYNDIDYDNPEDICNIYKAAYISILKNKSYVTGSGLHRKPKYIKYNDIVDILNNVFNYKIDKSEGKIKTGKIWKIIKDNLISLENMLQGFKIYANKNKELVIDPKEIEEKYKDIINNK